MEVSMEITQGTWSKAVIARGRAIVFGKLEVQAKEAKNQSSLSSRAAVCMLLHVNLVPLRGISTKPRWLMASLKRIISLILALGLFLSWGDLRIRLKSPNKRQFSSEGVCTLWINWRNSNLSLSWHGVYMFVSIQYVSDLLAWNSTERAYLFWNTSWPVNIELS
jgi:hypothetical protein